MVINIRPAAAQRASCQRTGGLRYFPFLTRAEYVQQFAKASDIAGAEEVSGEKNDQAAEADDDDLEFSEDEGRGGFLTDTDEDEDKDM